MKDALKGLLGHSAHCFGLWGAYVLGGAGRRVGVMARCGPQHPALLGGDLACSWRWVRMVSLVEGWPPRRHVALSGTAAFVGSWAPRSHRVGVARGGSTRGLALSGGRGAGDLLTGRAFDPASDRWGSGVGGVKYARQGVGWIVRLARS